MKKKFPLLPAKPERVCWGCDQYCSVDSMACSNERSPHPVELFGEDWLAWGDNRNHDHSPADGPAMPDKQGQSQTSE